MISPQFFEGKRYDEGYDKRIANEADSWISVPLLFGFLFQQFYNLMDTLIVGRFLGVDDLAAVGSTGSVNFLIIGFCMGVCNGFAIPLAHKFGAGDYKGMRGFMMNAIYLSAIFAVVMTIVTDHFLYADPGADAHTGKYH